MLRFITRGRVVSTLSAAAVGLMLFTTAPAPAAAAEPTFTSVTSVARSTGDGAGILATCQSDGWNTSWSVRCKAWILTTYLAWADCTSLSSSWPSYRAVSGPRQTAGNEWGAWTRRLYCSPASEYYISNAGWTTG
jgi:hypothetical protein